MSTTKTIPATELQPGDSFAFDFDRSERRDYSVFFVVEVMPRPDGGVDLAVIDDERELVGCDAEASKTVTVGFTSRWAKRQRGKIRGRARKAARPRRQSASPVKKFPAVDWIAGGGLRVA